MWTPSPDEDASPGDLPEIRRSPEGWSQYDPGFIAPICERVARGESLRSICHDPGMPSTQTLYVWRKAEPEFAEALAEARRTAQDAAEDRRAERLTEARHEVMRRRWGRPANPGRTSTYDETRGQVLCLRIAAGESLQAICRDPDTPAVSTVYNWLRRHAAFEAGYVRAREMLAWSLGERMIELADGATPEALGVIRLRIAVLKAEARRLGIPGGFRTLPAPPVTTTTYVRWKDIAPEDGGET